MVDGRWVREEPWTSELLMQAAEKLNFIRRLAGMYRAPELVEFLDAVADGLRGPEGPLGKDPERLKGVEGDDA